MSKKKPSGKGSKKMTPKQKALVALMPIVESGQMTMKAAMLKAGYAESTAREQTTVMGQIGNNASMQAALRKVGFNEEFIAKQIADGARKLRHGRDKLGYLQTGAGLLNVEPPKKVISAQTDIESLINGQESV